LPAYEGPMFAFLSHYPPISRSLIVLALLALGAGLAGCASVGDTISPAFADPAKYDLYDCKQLESERKALADRAADLQRLIAKAETGVGGSVVVEMAYRNDVIANSGQRKLAEEGWRRNKCQESKLESKPESKPDFKPVTGAAAAPPARPPGVKGAGSSKAGSALY
jgi:hypothetical protein